MIIKNIRFLIQDVDHILENIDLEIKNGIISEIYINNNQNNNLIVMPGFINSHTHAAMIALRGYSDDKRLMNWLNDIWKIEEKMDSKIINYASKLAIFEMLSTGTLGFIDQYFHEFETAKVAQEFGVFAALGTPFIDKNFNERIEKLDKFVNTFKGSELIKPILNPHSIYTCVECLQKMKELKEKYNLIINIHAAETRKEVMECYKKHSKFVIEYLASLGLLQNSILAHCGWIKKSEITLIKENNAFVVNNPSSNMKLATGAFFPYAELIEQGVNVGIGTDGAASNNSLNIFTEMKTMALLHKNNYWDAEVITAKECLKSAWQGWKIFDKDYRLIKGNDATFIVIEPNITLLPLRKDNLFSNLVYSFNGQISSSYIKGNKIFDNNKTPFDLIEIENKLNRLFN